MQRRQLSLNNSDTSSVSVCDLHKFAEGWLLSCEISQHSDATLSNRTLITKNLLWWLDHKGLECCGVNELRQFLAYLNTGHKEPCGRWGNPRQNKPVKPRTVKDYHGCLRTFFQWILKEGAITFSPMERIDPPVDRADDVQPFTQAQVELLLNAARKGPAPRRDEAILFLLYDTGLRASELCSLTMADIEMSSKTASVEGKGGKRRQVPFGKVAASVLWRYLREDEREADDPLFFSRRGEALTRLGLLQLFMRLGDQGKITGVRCSPHTMRHTFAVTFLINGGNQMTLMRILGHTNIQMTARYVQLAQADVNKQHRQFSPADGLKGGKRK